MDINVANCVQKDNGTLDPDNLHLSPGWQNRKLPLNVTHDRALAGAMARDGWPIICIPPTQAGVLWLAAALAMEPHRERDDDREVHWITPQEESAERAAATEARAMFDDANLSGTAPFYTSFEHPTWGVDDYEARLASHAAADQEAEEWDIAEERRQEAAEKERRAEEKVRRLEREQVEAHLVASPGWEHAHLPLHVCHDRAVLAMLTRHGIPAACIPPTGAGVKCLVDALRARPPREYSRGRPLVWLRPVVRATDAAWDRDYDEEAYAAQSTARGAAHEAAHEFVYHVWCSSHSDSPLGYAVREWDVPDWPSGAAVAEYRAAWEDELRETPREKWVREVQSILLPIEVIDALTDEEVEAYDERLRALGPIPAPAPHPEDPVREKGSGSPAAASGPPRPVIATNDVQYRDIEDQAHAALVAAACQPRVFVGPGGLSELYRPGPHATRRVRLLTPAALRRLFAAAADWQRKTEKKTVAAFPPPQLLDSYLARGEWPGLPDLVGVTTIPILRADGSVCQTPGYDPTSKLFFEPNGEFDRVPEHPTREDAKAAVADLLFGFRDFPFVSDVDRAALLAAVLTLVARPLIAGACPLFFATAPAAGTGKSAIIGAAALIATGNDADTSNYPNAGTDARPREDEAEIRKLGVSCAMSGAPVHMLDNLPSGCHFGSGALDALITMTTNSGRALGTNDAPARPARTVYYANGNNIRPRGDSVRRVVGIRMCSPVENPYKARYRGPEIKRWARAERHRLLPAALTILAAYLRAGRPDQGLPVLGSFEDWSDLVRSAIVWCGLPDCCTSGEEYASEDPEARTTAALIDLLAAAGAESEPVTAGRVITLVATEFNRYERKANPPAGPTAATPAAPAKAPTAADWDALADSAPAGSVVAACRRAFPGSHLPNATELGKLLVKYLKRPVGDRRIVKAGEDGNKKVALYAVERINPPAEQPRPAPPPP